MAQKLPNPPFPEDFQQVVWRQWFDLLTKEINTPKVIEKSGNPVAADIPVGTWGVWKNTATNTVRVWANNNGTLVSATLI